MPAVVIAHVWKPPAVICVTLPRFGGIVVCPSLFSPQQTGVPAVVIAHVWYWPALICVTLPRFGGIVVCPSPLEPQQTGVPAVVIAQVCRSPASIAVYVAPCATAGATSTTHAATSRARAQPSARRR